MKDSTNETKSKLENEKITIPSCLLNKISTRAEFLNYCPGITAGDLITAGIPKSTAYKLIKERKPEKYEGKFAPFPKKALKVLSVLNELTSHILRKIAAASCDETGITLKALKDHGVGITGYEIKKRLSRQKALHITIEGQLLKLGNGAAGLFFVNGSKWGSSEKGMAATVKARAAAATIEAKEKRKATISAKKAEIEKTRQFSKIVNAKFNEHTLEVLPNEALEETTRRKLAENAKTLQTAAQLGIDTDWIDKALNSESLPATTAKEETAPATITSQTAAQRIEDWKAKDAERAKREDAEKRAAAKRPDPPGLVDHNKLKAENAKSRATTDKIFGALMSTAGNDDNQLTSDQKLIVKYYREQGRPYKYALEMAKNHPELATEIKAALAKLETKKAEKQAPGAQIEPEPVTVAPATPKTEKPLQVYVIKSWREYFKDKPAQNGGNLTDSFEAILRAYSGQPEIVQAAEKALTWQAEQEQQADQWWQGIKAKYNIKSKY